MGGLEQRANFAKDIPEEAINTPPRQKAAEGFEALEDNNLKAASLAFNQALKMDIQNSYVQFLNGLTYHLMALQGDSQSYPLAEQGYALAVKFDKSNWLASFYRGLLAMDQKRWPVAQEYFARAALINPTDPDVLYQLAAASYYAGQPSTALVALRRLNELSGQSDADPRVVQGLAISTASLGDFNEAEDYFNTYRGIADDAAEIRYLRQRIESWKSLHSSSATARWQVSMAGSQALPLQPKSQDLAQFVEPDQGFVQPAPPTVVVPIVPPAEEGAPAAPAAPDQSAFAETSMVVVDVVLIGTEEDETSSRGVNLLSGLQLQFGNPLAPNPAAIGWSQERTKDKAIFPDEGSFSNVHTLIRAIQIPSVTYSLNIANADDRRSEIIAKPTLTALVGEPSEFFSGVDVNAAAVSGAAGDSVAIQKQIGVLLQVTPELLPDDMVKLRVRAERTFLTTPSQSVVFQFRLDTTKTSVNANVAMRFGETLILSGLMERATENDRDGVPIMQDIPGLQYLFSRDQKREFNKSVLILLTPRHPHYVGQPRGKLYTGNDELNDRERAIELLADRYRDWFIPMPNDAAIFQHIQFNQLYLEFRTGDFPLERWDHSRPHKRRLREAIRHIYY